jgi:hypothetical protein
MKPASNSCVVNFSQCCAKIFTTQLYTRGDTEETTRSNEETGKEKADSVV